MGETESVTSAEGEVDPASFFNELMRRTDGLLTVVDGIRSLNPAFVVKLYTVLEGVRNSRQEANAQHTQIGEALINVFPEDDQRLAVTNWFVFLAMSFGYGQAHRSLTKFVDSGGDPLAVSTQAPPAPQIEEARIPGFKFGPWKSPARRRAAKAVASLGNPNGAGRVFKAALETYAQTKAALATSADVDAEATNLVKTALDEPAIEIFIDGDGEALLATEISRNDVDDYDCSVDVNLVESWRDPIQSMMEKRIALSGSVKFWAPTLERLGFDPSSYDD